MTVTQDLSILSLILNASWAVQAIMVLLLFVSLMSWYYIFRKMFSIRLTRRQTEDFERSFWSRPDLNALYQSAVNARHRTGALERIFEAGFRDYVKLKTQHVETSDLVDGARRAMRATYQREMDHLESHLAFLASVGSVSPYVGLLGTVWGIMHSFRGLANVAQATSPLSPGHRRGAGRDRDRPLRRDPRGGRVQPVLVRHRAPVGALRELHGGVLEHPAAAGGEVAAMGRPRKLMNQINVVPYVDVMLVLLVIFMVTAPLVSPGLVELPSVGKASQPPETPLEVLIRTDQSMLLRERVKGQAVDRNVSMAQLVTAVRQKQAQSPEQAVVISADKDVRYEAVLRVMGRVAARQGAARRLMVKPAQMEAK